MQPTIVSQPQWHAARLALLEQERRLTRLRDEVNAQRRALPWMKVEQDYPFDTPQLMVPYTLDANDMRFVTPQGFNSGRQFFEYLRDSFDVLYAEGGRMMSVGLHCRLAGRPGRTAAVARFLDHITAFDDVWVCRRIDIAGHWREKHPPGSGDDE